MCARARARVYVHACMYVYAQYVCTVCSRTHVQARFRMCGCVCASVCVCVISLVTHSDHILARFKNQLVSLLIINYVNQSLINKTFPRSTSHSVILSTNNTSVQQLTSWFLQSLILSINVCPTAHILVPLVSHSTNQRLSSSSHLGSLSQSLGHSLPQCTNRSISSTAARYTVKYTARW